MKATANKVNTPTNLKGMAKHTYNRVMSAMVEDSDPAMLHTFAALTEGAKAIALQSGNFSNLYVRGINKSMTAEEAANELAERAAALVSRKLRKIDMICAAAFLAEYISRQRKEAEQPEPTNPDNTPTTMNANEINDRRYFINGKEVTANRYAAMKRLNAYIGRKQAEAFSRGDMENIATRAAWFTYEAAADAEYSIARYIEDCRRLGYLKEETAAETNTTEFSELSHAGQCLDIYLHNTREIYDRYTVPAIDACVKAQTVKAPEMWEYIKQALKAAARLVVKYDGISPTADDIKAVTANYVAYITECAEYNATNA